MYLQQYDKWLAGKVSKIKKGNIIENSKLKLSRSVKCKIRKEMLTCFGECKNDISRTIRYTDRIKLKTDKNAPTNIPLSVRKKREEAEKKIQKSTLRRSQRHYKTTAPNGVPAGIRRTFIQKERPNATREEQRNFVHRSGKFRRNPHTPESDTEKQKKEWMGNALRNGEATVDINGNPAPPPPEWRQFAEKVKPSVIQREGPDRSWQDEAEARWRRLTKNTWDPSRLKTCKPPRNRRRLKNHATRLAERMARQIERMNAD